MRKLKTKRILAMVLVIIVVVFILSLVFRNEKDAWLCQNNEWVRQGNPSEEKPTDPCTKGILVTSFEECADANYSIAESYPRQCRTPGDKVFIENIGNIHKKADIIQLNNPYPNQIIESPLSISGQAKRSWFSEGEFPVKLFDENEKEIAVAVGMNSEGLEVGLEEFVSFEVVLEFKTPKTSRGFLTLEKNDPSILRQSSGQADSGQVPSGLTENFDGLRIPIRFKK